MATAAQVQITSAALRYKPRERSDGWLFAAGSARNEAQVLIDLIRRGRATVDEVRELIEVPSELERELRRYARELYLIREGQEAKGIERVLAFRKKVAKEFEHHLSGN